MAELKAGDLVYVKRPPHKCLECLTGNFYTVTGVGFKNFRCTVCGNVLLEAAATVDASSPDPAIPAGLPVAWLVKIPPLGELQEVEQREELTA